MQIDFDIFRDNLKVFLFLKIHKEAEVKKEGE